MSSSRTLSKARGVAFGSLLTACVLVACGSSSDTTATDEWATDVCVSLSSFFERLQQQGAALQSAAAQDPSDLAATKADLVKFTDDGVTSTEDLIGEIEGIGAPDMEGGDAIADGLNDSLEGVKQGFSDAKGQAEALPVDNPVAFAQGVQDLSSAIQDAGQKSVDTLRQLTERYPDMAKALNDQPQCQQLQSSTQTQGSGG